LFKVIIWRLQLHQGQGAALHHSKAIKRNHIGLGYPLNSPPDTLEVRS
jgi:hypothetical protein